MKTNLKKTEDDAPGPWSCEINEEVWYFVETINKIPLEILDTGDCR